MRPFSQGLAAIQVGSRWGFIDKKGNVVIPLQFDRAGSFIDNRAWIVSGKSVGYIDRTGRTVVAPYFAAESSMLYDAECTTDKYDKCYGEDYFDGLARVMTRRGCWAYIDTEGQFVWQFAGRVENAPCVASPSVR